MCRIQIKVRRIEGEGNKKNVLNESKNSSSVVYSMGCKKLMNQQSEKLFTVDLNNLIELVRFHLDLALPKLTKTD